MSVFQRLLATTLFALLALFSFHSMKAIAAPPVSGNLTPNFVTASPDEAADEDEDEDEDGEDDDDDDDDDEDEGEEDDD